MHPWHDIEVDESQARDRLPAVIEIPKGSKNKYELDKRSGLLRLDRVLYGAMHYPANYGFIPRTWCDDGDALDVLVLGQGAIHPLVVVEVRPIGVMHMRDEKGQDHKIIAVNVHDPAVMDYTSIEQLPRHLMREVRGFFEYYKVLERKEVVVNEPLGAEQAAVVIRAALDAYRHLTAPVALT
jgi:inorganic pyrophosphatase